MIKNNAAIEMQEDTSLAPAHLLNSPSTLTEDEHQQAAEYAAISNPRSRQLLTYPQAVALSALPLNILNVRGNDRVSILTADTHLNSSEYLARIQFILHRSVTLVYLPPQIVKQAIYLAYRGDTEGLKQSITELQQISETIPPKNRVDHLQLDARAGQGEISKFLIDLLDYAIAINASDIHIIAQPNGTLLKLRQQREIMSAQHPFGSMKTHEKIIGRLKILAGLDINCRFLPQDGAFNLNCPNGTAKIRIAVTPTIYGETVILRVHQQNHILDVENLGFLEHHISRIKALLARKSGLILFCGSVGCGKSTTAAASLKYLLGINKAISSVEDPVEIEIPGIIHTQVNPDQGYDYASAVKSSLRQDPDVLFVGEIRDTQTAKISSSAALTGHLTISTLHCSNTYEGLLRLINMGVDNYCLAASSLAYLHQRLLPRACEHCKELDPELSASIGAPIYNSRGCSKCKETGSNGTELIYSLNICNHNFKEILIPQICSPEQFTRWLLESERIDFRETLKDKLIQGRISSNTARRFLNME
jgi:type IV pilus assembly protein PilB